MPSRNATFEIGSTFHIYNRGCNKGKIFFEEDNYIFLLNKIKKYSIEFKISVLSYCLIPNHYHLVLRQNSEEQICKCVQFIFNGYVKAINKKYKRSGTLFEGKFKSVEIYDDKSILFVCRYVHRNPVDDKLVTKIEDWKYSNYLEWIGKRDSKLFDENFVKKYFPAPELYSKFVLDYFSDKQAADEMRKYKQFLRSHKGASHFESDWHLD
ncbi:MAG: transposase [Ignavibacteriaceae bacterium]